MKQTNSVTQKQLICIYGFEERYVSTASIAQLNALTTYLEKNF